MIKIVALGLWVCAVTLGAAYAAMTWQTDDSPQREAPVALEQVTTKMISVPVIGDGAVQGYVLAQFVFTMEAEKLKQLATKPDLFLVDEAYKVIYAGEAVDFRHLRRTDVAALAKIIKENVNKRFGQNLVQEVLVQELNFLPKEQIRARG
jgi:hypothetical protein